MAFPQPRSLPPELQRRAPDMAASAHDAGSVRRLLKPALLLLGLLAAGLLLRHLPDGRAGLLPAAELLQRGVRGPLLFLLLGTLICTVGMPRQAVCFASGIAYGLWAGVLLSSVATIAGCMIGFLWARVVARDWARRRLEARAGGWLSRLDRLVSANPFGAVLTFRLLPVGSSLALNLGAGVLGLRTLPFLAATTLGSLPQTVIFTLLGAGTRIGHTTQIAMAVLLFVASGLLGLMLIRRGVATAA